MRPMVTSKGIHTQGIYAFINMLNKIIADNDPDYIAVAFDMKEKTFRHEQYAEYKAGRLATPIELLAEIPLLHDVLRAMNIAVLEKPRYEADDIIGTVAKAASSNGLTTIVISGDKDELQLVDENTRVLINKKGMSEFDLYDVQAMRDRYDLTPKQFIDLKGLMGDKSDNIPGVPGVGEKKGIALLKQYETLENVLEHADEIPGKLGENVRENRESARLSKWLATINVDSPIDFTWDELKFTEPDYAALIDVYKELEFSSFIKRLENRVDADEISFDDSDFMEGMKDIKTVDFKEFLKTVNEQSGVYIDVETDDNHLAKPEISGISLYNPDKNLFSYIEVSSLNCEVITDALLKKNYKLHGFDLKKQIYSLLHYSEENICPEYDLLIAEYLIDPTRSNYSIDKMALKYINASGIDFSDNKTRLYAYSRIESSQFAHLTELKLDNLFASCEMPLVITLAEMEKAGIKLNEIVLKEIGTEIDERIKLLESTIYEQSGKKFNINSPKQLADVLFVDMGIPYPKAGGKSGSYSTAADILDKLKFDYEIVKNVLEFRKCSKLKSTYIDGLLSLIAEDGKIHPHFQQTVTATGRLSCTEPNLQNIPIRDEYGRNIRKAFVVDSDENVFTGSDYSQIELRILAALSGDESMVQAFKDGKDIHRATASRVFDIPEDEVSSLDRSRAKAVNFGVVYGMSGFGLGENLNISRQDAQKYIDEYFVKHPGVKAYLDKNVADGEELREVRTYFGRLRKIPEFASRKYMEREFAKRLAMNTPIQGTAADIIKLAMNAVYEELRTRNLKSRLILQIHDELIIEGPENELDEVKSILNDKMVNAADLGVSLLCDIHSGKTLYELK